MLGDRTVAAAAAVVVWPVLVGWDSDRPCLVGLIPEQVWVDRMAVEPHCQLEPA